MIIMEGIGSAPQQFIDHMTLPAHPRQNVSLTLTLPIFSNKSGCSMIVPMSASFRQDRKSKRPSRGMYPQRNQREQDEQPCPAKARQIKPILSHLPPFASRFFVIHC